MDVRRTNASLCSNATIVCAGLCASVLYASAQAPPTQFDPAPVWLSRLGQLKHLNDSTLAGLGGLSGDRWTEAADPSGLLVCEPQRPRQVEDDMIALGSADRSGTVGAGSPSR
jgi:hypothetical protein